MTFRLSPRVPGSSYREIYKDKKGSSWEITPIDAYNKERGLKSETPNPSAWIASSSDYIDDLRTQAPNREELIASIEVLSQKNKARIFDRNLHENIGWVGLLALTGGALMSGVTSASGLNRTSKVFTGVAVAGGAAIGTYFLTDTGKPITQLLQDAKF